MPDQKDNSPESPADPPEVSGESVSASEPSSESTSVSPEGGPPSVWEVMEEATKVVGEKVSLETPKGDKWMENAVDLINQTRYPAVNLVNPEADSQGKLLDTKEIGGCKVSVYENKISICADKAGFEEYGARGAFYHALQETVANDLSKQSKQKNWTAVGVEGPNAQQAWVAIKAGQARGLPLPDPSVGHPPGPSNPAQSLKNLGILTPAEPTAVQTAPAPPAA